MQSNSNSNITAEGGNRLPPNQPNPRPMFDSGEGDEMAPVLPTASAELDWHREILCGLFIRSDEQELEWLERTVASKKTSGLLDSPQHTHTRSSSQAFNCLSSENGGNQAGEGWQEVPKIVEKQQTGACANNDVVLKQKHARGSIRDNRTRSMDEILNGLLHLEQAMDLTVISLIPEALQYLPFIPSHVKQTDDGGNQEHICLGGGKSNAQAGRLNECTFSSDTAITLDCAEKEEKKHHKFLKDEQLNVFNNLSKPLCIPSSWRRPNYARRTLSELEQHIIDSGRGGIIENRANGNRSVKNGKNGSHPPHKRGPKCYDLFTFLYNECSLTAMAHWGMLDLASAGTDNGETKEKWKKFKEKDENRRATDTSHYDVLIPNPSFHLCGVCGGFGHYEPECELILDGNKTLGGAVIPRDEELETACRKRKRRMLDGNATEFVLDEKKKDSVVSSLSKEIHIQRRQKELFDNFWTKKNQENHTKEENLRVTPAAQASQLLNQMHNMPNEERRGEEQYTGKSYCCKICHSGLDDGEMLLCDGCDELFHCKCLDPPLDRIPDGDWFCNSCLSYDSDASSAVEIEGCGDFLIEQRKRSVAKETKLYGGVNLGQTKSLWTTALSIFSEQDPIVKDELYLKKHLSREHGHLTEDFFLSELCWVKRLDGRLGRIEWWPAMVSDSETRLLKSSQKTTYRVKLFALDEDAEIRETEILPFLPYYEDIGHKRLMRRDNSSHDMFHHALILCVLTLGLKSLGQALMLARKGVQMAALMNNEHRKVLPPDWTIPDGWESAEIDMIDSIVILAKEGSGNNAFTEKRSHKSPIKRRSLASSANYEDNPVQVSVERRKMVAQFCIDEVLGGIVSWRSDFNTSQSEENVHVRYGLVVSLDTATNMALVRAMPMLSNLSHGHQLIHDGSSDQLIYATNVGSNIWIPLSHIRFVSGKPRELGKFKRKLKTNMKHELESQDEERRREDRYREEFTIELEDTAHGQDPWS